MEVSSFYDFLQSGLELNFHCAVDFTGSNGDPKKPNSLHYVNQGRTQYSDAIYAVGNVVEPYDFDKTLPAYGFGGFTKQMGTSHAFPLDQVSQRVECMRVQGILNAYFASLQTVQLSGPTNFSPVLKKIRSQAEGTYCLRLGI